MISTLKSSVFVLAMVAMGFWSTAWAAPMTSFYVAAHPDDWQLFMNPTAYNEIRQSGVKVVFIYTTAGDAGNGTGTIGRPQPYYVAREEGARAAVRFAATKTNGTTGITSTQTRNGHGIPRYTYLNTASYFLRLPDGNFDGAGYANTDHQSLERLATGAIPRITSITASATYNGWTDLAATLRAIILAEAKGSTEVRINIPDTDESRNPQDHSDHLYTGRVMLDAVKTMPCVDKVLYVDYETENKPINISTADLINDAGVWGATVSGIIDFFHKSTWNPAHNPFLGRNYFRVLPGVGECNF